MNDIPKGFSLVTESDPSLPEGFSLLNEEDDNDPILGAGETAASLLSGGVALPISGLAGLVTGDPNTVRETQEALTYSPRTGTGKKYVENVNKFLEEKIRQPMISQASDLTKAIPLIGDQLDENTREFLGTLGTDVFLNLTPLEGIRTGARMIAKRPKTGINEAALKRLKEEPQKTPEIKSEEIAPELDLFSPDQKHLGRSPYDATQEGWVVDEHGIPIKQRLSEEVQRMESPEQGQLFDLPPERGTDPYLVKQQADAQRAQFELQQEQSRQIQEGRKQQEIEQAFRDRETQKAREAQEAKQAEVEDTLKRLEEDLRVERESRGQQQKAMRGRRNQRGAIDLEALTEGFEKLFHGGREFKQWNPKTVGKGEGMGALGPGLYASDNPKLAEIYKKYGDQISFDEAGNVVVSPGVLNEMAVKTTNILDYRKENPKWEHATKNLNALGLKGSTIQDKMQYAAKWGMAEQARRGMIDAGIDGMYIQLGGTMGKEIVIFNPEIIRQVSRTDTPIEKYVPQSQRGGINLDAFRNEEKARAVDEIIGTKLYAPEVSPEAVIAEALAQGKDSSGSINMAAGGALEGMKRNSPLVKGGVRLVQREKNIAEDHIRSFVLPVEKTFRGLKPLEIIDLGKVFMNEMMRRERFTAAELAEIGLNENQLLARQQMLSMFDDVLQKMNEARLEHGLSPITPQEAYLSSRWRGAFRQGIRDSEGKLVWYLAAETKKGLDNQVKALLKEFPDLVVDKKLEHTTRRGRVRTEPSELYHTMLDILGRDDPRVQDIKNWYEMQQSMDAESAYAQAKHFEKKGNIRGFVGDRPGKQGTKAEALALFQEQINYAKNGYNWAALNRAGQHLKEIFKNEELQAQQPKNLEYLREYYADQLGLNTYRAVQALEDSLHSVGISIDKINDLTGMIKQTWILQKLAGSVGYGLSQVLQAANMMPHLTNIMIRDRVNPLAIPASLIQGFAEGMLMATGHVVGKSDTLISSAKYRPGDSVFSAKAMKYAEDNSIITRSLSDESPIESSFSPMAKGLKAANKTISVPEAYLRSTVYMTYVHMLKFAGKHADDLALFREAEELTNASMGDYRAGERAMIFSKMGSVGNLANILQTYPINFYNQYSWAIRESTRKNPAPLFAMLATHYTIAGLIGIPGFQDLDKLWNWTKDQLAERSPQMWNKVKDWDLKQVAINGPLGESGLYGLASTSSGVSVTSRAAAPAGSEMLVNPLAPYEDLGSQALSVGKALVQPDQQTAAQAMLNTAPVGLQGMLETGLLRDQTSVQRPDGRLYGKPSDLAAREGMIVRSPEEERLRRFGLKSTREVIERDQAYAARQKELQAVKVARSLPDKTWNELRKGNKEKAAEYIKLYAELTGKSMTTEMFQQRALDEYTTAAERAQIKNKSVPGLAALKQLREILEEQNANK